MIVSPNKESINELKLKLKRKFPSLTDIDLNVSNNNSKNMLTMVAYRLRKSQEEMNKIIEQL